MKLSKLCLMAMIGGLACFPASAREWTSEDGKRNFKGEFKSFDESSQKVTVIKNAKELTFDVSKLSESDRKWIIEKVKEEKLGVVGKALAEQKIGSKLTDGTLSVVKDGKFAPYEFEKVPEYYIVYYSASW